MNNNINYNDDNFNPLKFFLCIIFASLITLSFIIYKKYLYYKNNQIEIVITPAQDNYNISDIQDAANEAYYDYIYNSEN